MMNCTHFGGDNTVLWRLSVAPGSHKGGPGGRKLEIEANGGDMYVTRDLMDYQELIAERQL
jgi:hypothetical protein